LSQALKFSHANVNDVACNLLKELENIDYQQATPAWPELIEIPVPIDRTTHDDYANDEEFVYWAN